MTRSAGRSAALVAAGIFVSRLLGFVRERVFAHYFGNSAAADAIRAALRIPNAIRNLLGEGTLSASFIPVYARLVESDDPRASRALAGAIASLLLLASGVAALIGIVAAPAITAMVAPGFDAETHRLTVTLVRIIFPGSGLLILAAWCLGVLTTHRRFFLPYAAPALWNVTQIAVLVAAGAALSGADLAVWLAWGIVAGSLVQLIVQLPQALRLAGGFQFRPSLQVAGVRDVLGMWTPVVAGAGVAQISAFVDTLLASLLETGAVASLGYAQLLVNLPIALFGVSVAAVSLPELSREAAGEPEAAREALRARLAAGLVRIVFYVLPCAVAFAVIGRPAVRLLYETGRFGSGDTDLVTGVLAAYSVGLLGYASVKLLSSGFYALRDTRTPVITAAISIVIAVACAWVLMTRLGPAGIALGGSIGALCNCAVQLLLLGRRVGPVLSGSEWRLVAVCVLAALPAAVAGWMTDRGTAAAGIALEAGAAWLAFGATYVTAARAAGHPEARRLLEVARGRLAR
jgi:putative peptidoglycan lipid II flippase